MNINNNICDHYSRAETNQGRKLLNIRRFLLRKLFKGGNYSRAETIRGNTVVFKSGYGTYKLCRPLQYEKTQCSRKSSKE